MMGGESSRGADRSIARPQRRGGMALGLIAAAVLVAWIGAVAVTLRAAALAPDEAGKLFVVFAPGTSAADAFASILGAGGAPIRPALGGLGWIAHGVAPGFVGRLEDHGALLAFGGAPAGIPLAGCVGLVGAEARSPADPFARAIEARLAPGP